PLPCRFRPRPPGGPPGLGGGGLHRRPHTGRRCPADTAVADGILTRVLADGVPGGAHRPALVPVPLPAGAAPAHLRRRPQERTTSIGSMPSAGGSSKPHTWA